MERRNFIRKIENFTCEHCGTEVSGSGYTNHCPECLWSKHVDNIPGDRANDCGGLMRPTEIEVVGSNYNIVHQCEDCGAVKRNKVADNDNRIVLANILKNQ